MWMRPKVPPVDVLTAKLEDVRASVVASARVLSTARVDIGATITGRVQKVAVREGERVAEGQLLVQLEQAELLAAVTQARAVRERACRGDRGDDGLEDDASRARVEIGEGLTCGEGQKCEA